MKGKVKKLLFLLSFTLTVSTAVTQNVEPALRYVFTDYYPVHYLDEEGKPTGYFVDIMREVLQTRLGIPLEISVYPWPRCQIMVENNQADMITTSATPERLAYCLKVDAPIWISRQQIYTWAGHPGFATMNTIKNFQDLKKSGFSVVSYLGNSWAETNLNSLEIPVINASSLEGMYKMLNAHRGDIIIETHILVDPVLSKMKLDRYIVQTKGFVEEVPFYALIGKNSAYAAQVSEMTATLNAMWKDGTIDRIMKTYNVR